MICLRQTYISSDSDMNKPLQSVLNLAFISSFFVMSNALSSQYRNICTQQSRCWTCENTTPNAFMSSSSLSVTIASGSAMSNNIRTCCNTYAYVSSSSRVRNAIPMFNVFVVHVKPTISHNGISYLQHRTSTHKFLYN